MGNIQPMNVFNDIPHSDDEWFQTLLDSRCVRIERIVSRGHASPEDFWYDQDWDEWVLLISGNAGLAIEGRSEVVELSPGDWLLLPAGVRHRVAWTAAQVETIWLAVHVKKELAT